MLLKIGKMTPLCLKQLPGDEYTGESRLPGGEYTWESQLLVMKHRGVLTPLWWLHQGVDFLVYFDQASEQVYKKKLSGE